MQKILKVNTLSELSMDIYDYDNCIKDKQTADEIIQVLKDNLSAVYTYIECLDDLGVIEKLNNTRAEELRSSIDLYQIGDTINLLSEMKVEPENPEDDEEYLVIPFF